MPRTDSAVPRPRRPRPRRRRCVAVATGIAVWAPTLLLGGALARAAMTPGAPASASVTWTGPHGQPGGPATTTTTLPRRSNLPAPPGTVPTPGGPGVPGTPGTSDGADGSAQQDLVVSIPPGPLTVSPSSESVPLTGSPSFGQGASLYRGDLLPLTVTDARGSLVGWRATVSPQGVAGVDPADAAHAIVCADPRRPTMVAGNPKDVVRGSARSCAGVGGTLSIFFAAPGGGGGTYSDGAGLTLLLPPRAHASQVTVSLAVAVH